MKRHLVTLSDTEVTRRMRLRRGSQSDYDRLADAARTWGASPSWRADLDRARLQLHAMTDVDITFWDRRGLFRFTVRAATALDAAATVYWALVIPGTECELRVTAPDVARWRHRELDAHLRPA